LGSESKRQMVESAALLFREQGYSGTGFRDVIEHSGAPRGSIYHHFPGGKAELAAETVRYAGSVIETHIDRLAREGDAIAVLRAFVGFWQRLLDKSEFRAGCPVVAVAVEAHDDAAVIDATGEAFEAWEQALATTLRRSGASPARALRLSTLCIAAIEGAVVMCRAQRSTQPLADVGRELEETIAAAQAG
jgi:AcrR family transcriptional regulator